MCERDRRLKFIIFGAWYERQRCWVQLGLAINNGHVPQSFQSLSCSSMFGCLSCGAFSKKLPRTNPELDGKLWWVSWTSTTSTTTLTILGPVLSPHSSPHTAWLQEGVSCRLSALHGQGVQLHSWCYVCVLNISWFGTWVLELGLYKREGCSSMLGLLDARTWGSVLLCVANLEAHGEGLLVSGPWLVSQPVLMLNLVESCQLIDQTHWGLFLGMQWSRGGRV